MRGDGCLAGPTGAHGLPKALTTRRVDGWHLVWGGARLIGALGRACVGIATHAPDDAAVVVVAPLGVGRDAARGARAPCRLALAATVSGPAAITTTVGAVG